MRFNVTALFGLALMAGASAGTSAGAQTATDSSIYLKAQGMVSNGEAVAGRKLVDSLLKAAPVGSPQHAEGLYWRATLAPNGHDAERDYREVVVDYPLSPRVSDALLRMGEFELQRGDRDAALQHFQRLVTEHPESQLHAEASYFLAQTYFEKNDVTHGCVSNLDAENRVMPSNVELKNRIDYQKQRCRGISPAQIAAASQTRPATNGAVTTPATTPATTPTTASAAPPPVATNNGTPVTAAANIPNVVVGNHTTSKTADRVVRPAPPTALPTAAPAPKKVAVKPAPAPRAAVVRTDSASMPARATIPASTATASTWKYSVQVAAFATRPPADDLMRKLYARGYMARVDGRKAPFRVRVGAFAKYADAAAARDSMKAKGLDVFIAER